MRESAVLALLKYLGIDDRELSVNGNWINCPCPMAHFRHPSGHDNRPSFGMSVNEEGLSAYKCFTCGQGSSYDMLQAYQVAGLQTPDMVKIVLMGEEGIDAPEISAQKRTTVEKIRRRVPVPAVALECSPLLLEGVGHEVRILTEYLTQERGVSEAILQEYGIRYRPRKDMLVFPYADTDWLIYILRARLLATKDYFYLTPARLDLDCPEWGSDTLLYGMDRVDDRLPLTVVEGELDALRLRTLGYGNVAATGGNISDGQLESIVEYGPEVILGFDSDEQGKKYCLRVMEARTAAGKQTVFKRLKWDSVGVKDAGELKSEAMLEAVLAAASSIDFLPVWQERQVAQATHETRREEVKEQVRRPQEDTQKKRGIIKVAKYTEKFAR